MSSWECPFPNHFYDIDHKALVKRVLNIENINEVAYLNCSFIGCVIIRKRWKYEGCTEKTFIVCQKFMEHNLSVLKDALDRKMIRGWPPAYLAGIVEKELNEYGEDWFKNAG